MGIYRKLCTVCNLSSGCVKCREDWDYNGDSNDGFLCDHHGMVGNYDITTSENLSPEVLCRKEAACFSESFKRIGITLKNVKKEKKVFLFLLAFFFYIDGVYTIIDMATAYGSALGLSSTGLLLALLLTQIVAFPFAIYFRKTGAEIFCRKVDHSMYRGIPWSGNFCDFSALPVAVLGSCSLGRYVPGRCAGAFKILLYEDHTGKPVR